MDDFGKEKNFGCKEKYGTLWNSEEKFLTDALPKLFLQFFVFGLKNLHFLAAD